MNGFCWLQFWAWKCIQCQFAAWVRHELSYISKLLHSSEKSKWTFLFCSNSNQFHAISLSDLVRVNEHRRKCPSSEIYLASTGLAWWPLKWNEPWPTCKVLRRWSNLHTRSATYIKGSLTNLTFHAVPVLSCIGADTTQKCMLCALKHDITGAAWKVRCVRLS